MINGCENRRVSLRVKKTVPVLLHREMVQTVNISSTGARLVVRGSKMSSPRIPILIEAKENSYAGLVCEPQWEEKIGPNLYILGVSFPENQEDLALLEHQLAS